MLFPCKISHYIATRRAHQAVFIEYLVIVRFVSQSVLSYFLIKIDIDGFSYIISDINMASLAPVVFTRSFWIKSKETSHHHPLLRGQNLHTFKIPLSFDLSKCPGQLVQKKFFSVNLIFKILRGCPPMQDSNLFENAN